MANALASYSTLSLRISTPFSLRKSAASPDTAHILFVRPHEPKIPTPESSRSLFVVNVPVDATAAHLRSVLTSQELATPGQPAFKISNITFEDAAPLRKSFRTATSRKRKRSARDGDDPLALTLPSTFSRQLHTPGGTAIVTYASERDAEAAYRAIQRSSRKGYALEWPSISALSSAIPVLGSARYKAHLAATFPSHTSLQDLVDNYMIELATHEAAVARAAAKARAVPDADGFVTVTRGSRTGPARQAEAEEALAAQMAKEEKKRKDMGGDFYRFQVRERRKQRERELQEQFQGDVERMKSLRA